MHPPLMKLFGIPPDFFLLSLQIEEMYSSEHHRNLSLLRMLSCGFALREEQIDSKQDMHVFVFLHAAAHLLYCKMYMGELYLQSLPMSELAKDKCFRRRSDNQCNLFHYLCEAFPRRILKIPSLGPHALQMRASLQIGNYFS